MSTWVSGPREALAVQGIDLGYRGERLGMPETGPGSVASYGRRIGALIIDWIACALVAALFFHQYRYGSPEHGAITMGVFFLEKAVFTVFGGSSFGQRITGVRIVAIGQKWVAPWRAALRTLLICLVIPAVIYDRDGRGLQDRLTGTIAVSMR